MFDHLGFDVADYAASRAFYLKALAPLGIGLAMELDKEATGGYEGCGFGPDGRPQLWIGAGARRADGLHVALAATSRAAVDAFHAAAIAAGGTDNGAPGLRPQYHPDYYAAFVIDLDGHNVEAVCHAPEAAPGAAA